MTYVVEVDIAQGWFPDYEFVETLTPSAQKCAFHVRDTSGRSLCLKLIAPDQALERVEREVLALQAVEHPGIARLIEYTSTTKDGCSLRYIVEEFVPGRDLSEVLDGNPWGLERIVRVFGRLCDALGALRDANVVHRDLKPSNIRMDTDGNPRIIDFGLARHLDLPDLTRTADGARIGTPLYFAPEQFDGTKYDIDHRTDLWAVGVLLYAAAIGVHPFHSANVSLAELRAAVCGGNAQWRVPEFEALAAGLQRILRRLLAVERERRYADARQVTAALERLGGRE